MKNVIDNNGDLSMVQSRINEKFGLRTYANSFTYNAAVNVVTDAEGRQFTYDAENKQVEVKDHLDNTIGEYFYDGDGKRVKKVVPTTGEVTIFVYDAGGKSIAEYSTVVANSNDAKVAFLTNDHLGSPRINTDQNGVVTARHDYHPFGEEVYTAERTVALNYSADSIRKQFTGYERDNETDLDFAQARMYQSTLGRFLTVDLLLNTGRPNVPKSWNRYSYSLNNPLRFIDPSGLYEYDANATSKQKRRFEKQLKNAEDQLAKIGAKYEENSDEYNNALRALKSYGKPGEINGIIVAFGKTSSGKLGDAAGLIGANGKKSITVTLDIDNIKDDGNLQTIIGHEGSHA